MLELSKQVVKERHFFLQDVSFEFTLRQQVMAIGFWFAFGVLGVLVTPLGAQPTHSDMLVGSERCTWGPAYWCSGLKQSAHCGATTHCIRSVWESNPYPEDDDEVCTKHRVNFSLFKMCSCSVPACLPSLVVYIPVLYHNNLLIFRFFCLQTIYLLFTLNNNKALEMHFRSETLPMHTSCY